MSPIGRNGIQKTYAVFCQCMVLEFKKACGFLSVYGLVC